MIRHFLDFERPIAELESKIEELRRIATTGELNIAEEIERLQHEIAAKHGYVLEDHSLVLYVRPKHKTGR